jgi:hypothetical protein
MASRLPPLGAGVVELQRKPTSLPRPLRRRSCTRTEPTGGSRARAPQARGARRTVPQHRPALTVGAAVAGPLRWVHRVAANDRLPPRRSPLGPPRLPPRRLLRFLTDRSPSSCLDTARRQPSPVCGRVAVPLMRSRLMHRRSILSLSRSRRPAVRRSERYRPGRRQSERARPRLGSKRLALNRLAFTRRCLKQPGLKRLRLKRLRLKRLRLKQRSPNRSRGNPSVLRRRLALVSPGERFPDRRGRPKLRSAPILLRHRLRCGNGPRWSARSGWVSLVAPPCG